MALCSYIIFFNLPKLSHLYRSNKRKYNIAQEEKMVIDKMEKI